MPLLGEVPYQPSHDPSAIKETVNEEDFHAGE